MTFIKTALLAGAALVAAESATPAAAQEVADWAKVGPWAIRVDPTLGHGCFMMGAYPDSGTVLRVGIDNLHNQSYFLFANPAWTSLEAGKQYPISLSFDGGPMEPVTAKAVRMGESTVLTVNLNSPSPNEVMTIFGRHIGVRILYNGNVIANLRLNGTAAAAAETIACNSQFASAGKRDPFKAVTSPGSVTKADPFI